MQGLVLLAHGSRDTNWCLPFERLRDRIQMSAPDQWISLAYMEMASPTLSAVLGQIPENLTQVDILPLFMATGGHMATDVPNLVRDSQEQFPACRLTLHPPAGEHPLVQQAFTDLALGLLQP